MSSRSHASKNAPWAAAVAALGVVMGDIGTSPLYAFRECFYGPHSIPISPDHILGVLSLIFWSLVCVVTIKYVMFVMRADNRGEGGTLALAFLVCPGNERLRRPILFALGLIGCAFLYGEGAITPAISVLGALEGLKIATPIFEPYILPLASAIIVALFAVQKYGTARIGAMFGPIMIVWFATLGILGISGIISNPSILWAMNPYYAVKFIAEDWNTTFLVLGSVFLCVTGGEALYADLGHFGRSPIRRAWLFMALPGLALNYFGQGALLLTDPSAASNPFYLLGPSWSLYPLIILATIVAAIASQAVITAVFSLSRQAIQSGFLPRMNIIHTSAHEIGQIYLPTVNWALMIGTLAITLSFKSSSALTAAYGVGLSTTMVITTIFMFVVARKLWKWSLANALALTAFFAIFDFTFFAANIIKIDDGGWFPLVIAGGVFTIMTTWRTGRELLADHLRKNYRPLTQFVQFIKGQKIQRVPGTAIFMVADRDATPPALLHNLKHNKILHERVIVLTVLTKEVPYVSVEDRITVTEHEEGFVRVLACYGFMQLPDVKTILRRCSDMGIDVKMEDVTFFLGLETLIPTHHPGMALWRERLFVLMSRNAHRATAFFRIPPDRVIEVGMQLEI